MGKVTFIQRDLDIFVQHIWTGAIEHIVGYELFDYSNMPSAVGFYEFEDGSIVSETSFVNNYTELDCRDDL